MRTGFLIFISVLLSINALYSEITISLNPGQIAFQKIANSDYYDAEFIVEVAVQSDESSWDINLLGFPLVSTQGDIPTDRQYIKKEFNPYPSDAGAGQGYEKMNSNIHLGSGGITSGYEVINRLQFRTVILDSDQQATYEGEAKIQTGDEQYYAVLSIILEVKPYLEFSIDRTDLLFEINGPPGFYDADTTVKLSHDANTIDWKIQNEFTGISPVNGLSGNSFFVSSSGLPYTADEGAGEGYKILSYPRDIMDGNTGDKSGYTTLKYLIKTEYNHSPGEYNGTLQIDSPEYPQPLVLNTRVNVSEYLHIEIDQTDINIESLGPPGIYDADKTIILKVASNTESWQVTAEATDLTGPDFTFPKERIFIKSDQQEFSGDEGAGSGYMALENERVVAEGSQMELRQLSNMDVRVKTTEMDVAGQYQGNINFIIISLP